MQKYPSPHNDSHQHNSKTEVICSGCGLIFCDECAEDVYDLPPYGEYSAGICPDCGRLTGM